MRNIPSDVSPGDGRGNTLYDLFSRLHNFPIPVSRRLYRQVEEVRKGLVRGFFEMAFLIVVRVYKEKNAAGSIEATTEKTLQSVGEVVESIRKRVLLLAVAGSCPIADSADGVNSQGTVGTVRLGNGTQV